MVTDYFFVYSYFFQCEEKNEKNFWDMEIIGNRRKMVFPVVFLEIFFYIIQTVVRTLNQSKTISKNATFLWYFKNTTFRGISYAHICIVQYTDNGGMKAIY